MEEKQRILSEEMERLEKESHTVSSVQSCASCSLLQKQEWFPLSVPCSGPSHDQEDGKDEAADRPEAAPELSEQPGLI